LREVRAKADTIARRIYNELLGWLDVSLSEAALLLPDIVDLDRKQEFDERTTPALRQGLGDGRFADLDALLAWLREEVAAMTPGSDPLPALKAPVGRLCSQWQGQWQREGVASPLLGDLVTWTQS
jgi:hypothetical protein